MFTRTQTDETESLRERIVQAAGRLFAAEGEAGLSMRRVAQEVGCSQMAMYRHFTNKEALIQHICAELYTQFATRIQSEIDGESDGRKKLRKFIRAVLLFAEQYPDHYSLIFLVRHADPVVVQTREALGQQFLKGISLIVREVLPANKSMQEVNTVLRRMMEVLHGTATLRLAHPNAYGVTRKRAIEDIEALWGLLLNRETTLIPHERSSAKATDC